ncbi:hypothetical protein VZO05_03705 [Aggregatilineales bacterium SYSU G02658]
MQSFNPNELYRYTALGRAIDPINYRSNLYIVLLTPAAGIVAGLVTLLNGGDLGAAVAAGFFTAAAVFIAWVYTRDIDPDYNASAFLAAAATLVTAPAPLVIISLAALAPMLRVVSRIVGPVPRLPEYIGVLVLLGIASVLDGGLVALAALVGFLLDARLPQATRWAWIGVGMSAALAVVGFVLQPLVITLPSVPYLLLGLGLLVAFGWAIWSSRSFTSTCDDPMVTVCGERIQAAMGVVAAVCLLSMAGGDALMQAYAPAWGSIVGVLLWRAKLLIAR